MTTKPEGALKNLGKLLIVAAGVLLFMVPRASADSVVVFNGSYSFGNGGYGIPPYGGTLDGQPADFYCVDFSHDISGGDTWPAIVTPLTNTSNYSSTYLYTGNNATTETIYMEFAWLITQEMGTTDQATIAADQWAIWSLTGGASDDPYTGATDSASYLLGEAQTAVVDDGFNASGWEILTPDNAAGGYGQEFMVQTPEPSALLLMGIGLLALFLLKRREWFGLRSAAVRSDS
jgi:hypothetical protein